MIDCWVDCGDSVGMEGCQVYQIQQYCCDVLMNVWKGFSLWKEVDMPRQELVLVVVTGLKKRFMQ